MLKLDVLLSVLPSLDGQEELKFKKRWGEQTKIYGEILEENVNEAFERSFTSIDEVVRERSEGWLAWLRGAIVGGTAAAVSGAGPLGKAAGAGGGYLLSEWIGNALTDQVDQGDIEAVEKSLAGLNNVLDWTFDVYNKLPEEMLRGYIQNIVTLENELTSLYGKIDQSEAKVDDVLKGKINEIKANIETNKSKIIDHLNEVVVPHNDSILAIYKQLKGNISEAQSAMQSGFKGILDDQLESWKESSERLVKYSVPAMEVIQEKLRILKAEGKGSSTEYALLSDTLYQMATDYFGAVSVYSGVTKKLEENTKVAGAAMQGVAKSEAEAVVNITAAAETSKDALKGLGDAITDLPAPRDYSEFAELIVPLNDVENAVGGVGAAVMGMTLTTEQAVAKTGGFLGRLAKDANDAADAAAKAAKKAFAQDMVKFVDAFDDEFKTVFGPEATGIINGFVGLFQKAEGDLTTMWDDHWAGVIGLGLNALGQMGGEVGNALKVVGNTFTQFQAVLDQAGGNFELAREKHWDQIVNIGLNALQQLAGGTNDAINAMTGAISGAMQGYKLTGGNPVGAIAGGALGFFGGLFGGGDDGAARAARMQEMQRKWQEETNRLMGEFIDDDPTDQEVVFVWYNGYGELLIAA